MKEQGMDLYQNTNLDYIMNKILLTQEPIFQMV